MAACSEFAAAWCSGISRAPRPRPSMSFSLRRRRAGFLCRGSDCRTCRGSGRRSVHRSPTEKPSMPCSSTSVMKASRSAARERAMRGSRSTAAVVAGAEAADVGAAAAEAAGIAAGAGVAAAPGVATWSALRSGWCRVRRVRFDGGIRCRQMSPLGSIIWSIKQVDYYSTPCSIVHYTARKHARQQTMEGLLSI